MAAEVEAIVQEESTNEEFHDASTELFQTSTNLDDFQSLEGDCVVQAEPVHTEGSPHANDTAAELTLDARDSETTEGADLPSPPPQEDVANCEGDEVLDRSVADSKDEPIQGQVLEGGGEEDKEVVAECVSSDSSKGETAEEEGNSLTVESEPREHVAIDDSGQKEGSDNDENDSAEEELAYEARPDSSHSEEEEVEEEEEEEEEVEEEEEEEEEGEEEEDGEQDEEEEGEGEQDEVEGEKNECDKEEAEGDEPAEGADADDTDEKEKKTEKPKDPSVVPRDNRYFLHDVREGEETEGDGPEEQDTQVAEEEPKTEADRVDRWEHDLFVRERQGPRTDQEKEKDTWRFDDTQRAQRRGSRRGFGRGRGQRFSHQDQGHGDRHQAYEGRNQRYYSQDQRRADQSQRYAGQNQRYGQDQRWDDRHQRREGQEQRSGRDQRQDDRHQRQEGQEQGSGRDQRQDNRHQRREGQDQRYGRDQRQDDWHQRREGQDQRYGRDQRQDDWHQRREGQDQRYGRDQRQDDRHQRREGQDQRYGRDQRQDDRHQRREGQNQRYNSQDQRQGGYHRRDRQQHFDKDGTGSLDDQSSHRRQQRRPDDEGHGSSDVATGQEYDKDNRQDGRPSYSRGGFIKGGSFHRDGFAAHGPTTRSDRSHGDDKREEKGEEEKEAMELNEAAITVGKGNEGATTSGKRPGSATMVRKWPDGAVPMGKWPDGAVATGSWPEGAVATGSWPEGAVMVGRRPEGAITVGKRSEGAVAMRKETVNAKDLPHVSKNPPVNDSSPPQICEGDGQEKAAQQNVEPLSQSKGIQQKSLFGTGTGQEGKLGKERKPTRLYSLARGRPASSVGGSGVKPGAATEEGSMDDVGKGHGTSSHPRSSKVPGSAYPVRTERSEGAACNGPPVEGEGEGDKGGGSKRYSAQRGSGEGGTSQRPVQGHPVLFTMPGDQYTQTQPNLQGSPQHSSGGGTKPKTQAAKGHQSALLATPAEGAPYGVTFIPGPAPPGAVAPVLSYLQPVEGMPPLAVALDPSMMMGNLEELGHFQGGLFIPHLPPEGQRMMIPMPGDSPQHVASLPYQPKQRSRAIPIVAPQATQEGEQPLDPVDSAS